MTKQDRRAALLMRRPSAVRFALLALIAPLILSGLLVWLDHEYDRSERLRQHALASFDRQIALVQTLSDLKDAETAQRGFLLTDGDAAFLAPYEPARRAAMLDLRSVDTDAGATADRRSSARIRDLIGRKFAEMDTTIAELREGRLAVARDRVRDGVGKRLMDELRRLVGTRIASEREKTVRARALFVAQRAGAQALALAVGLIAIVLISVLLFAGWRLRRTRFDALVEAFEAAERNQTILDSTIDAMLILNPSGTVEAINAAATAMLGYAAHEIERRDIAQVIDVAPGEGSFHQRVGLVDGQLSRTFLSDRAARHRDGSTVPVDVAIGVMVLPSGDHLVLSLRDISERKRLEQLKDDLMSTVSHELRTPLTSIVGSLGLLRAGSAGELPDAAERLVAIAENNSRRLIRLINDMLDIDRIESGMLEMHREPIDLCQVVEQAITGSEGLAATHGVTLDLAVPDEPLIVMGDADRLHQVVTNILSNAIRFTPEGKRVRTTVTSANGEALVAVDDEGPGVPPAFRQRIFGRFERAKSEAGLQGGAGLGLAISREIVQRHDGRIWFEDAETGGARFVFSVPQMRPAKMHEAGAARVLICEQDLDVASQLSAMVVKEGCAYELVETGREGLAALARHRFDAMLVDLNLPDDGGLAFARMARAGSAPKPMPIIVVAAHIRDDGAAPSGLDVVDWIEKPADVDRLTEALRRALARGGKERPVVLHLDDDEDLLQVVSAALEPETRIVTATDLPSARAILETVSPDAAILDIRLADGSGLDLIPFLVDENGLAVPTIIYSAQDVSSDLASQVDAVLVKARGSLPDLKATLRRVIRARQPDQLE